MTSERVTEIALAYIKWSYRQMGTELFMGDLKKAGVDLGVPDKEMFQFYLAIFDSMRSEMVADMKQEFTER